MDDNEYIRQLERAAALPDWIARKKAYLRINLRRLDTMVQEQTSVVLASKTNVANTSLDGLKAAAEKLAEDAAEYEAVKSRRDSTARSIHILDSEDEQRYREQNKDIDGTCQWNYSASGCGKPTISTGGRCCVTVPATTTNENGLSDDMAGMPATAGWLAVPASSATAANGRQWTSRYETRRRARCWR
ncbi:hypothetical protein [Bifidobacterium pseudocatenulatum]|uniref:hypothetical protein n=1 Tax=Bifidobacterium pseudocatenulatum TaxID=28026 RepID=UPI0018AA96AD|nr:hypothetical protein [Bifidobacterium pseudocatenulatum]